MTVLADTVGGLAIPNDHITIACLISLVLLLVYSFGLLRRIPEANRGFLNEEGVYTSWLLTSKIHKEKIERGSEELHITVGVEGRYEFLFPQERRLKSHIIRHKTR